MDLAIITNAVTLLQPTDMLFITAGVLIGIILAAVPGLSGSIGIAILLPFTYLLPPITSLATLGGLYAGAMYGGSISAILLNIPGCGAAVATALDGYPMAQQGKAADALYASAFASFFGGLVGIVALTFLIDPLSRLSLKFGPVEFFWLAVLGISTLASLTASNIIKGLMAGMLGIFLSLVGLDPLTGTDRFSFGIPELSSGVPIVPIIIAMFAVPQLLKFLENQDMSVGPYTSRPGVGKQMFKMVFSRLILVMIKSSIVGTIVGIIPGAGGYVASLVAYTETKGASKDPSSFGRGNVIGVVAAESANSATAGGALVPTLTFGIPGSNITAVLIGALLLHGFEPGPDLFVSDAPLIYAFIMTLYFSYFVMLLFGIVGPRYFSLLLKVRSNYIISSFLVICVIGSYAIRSNMTDVYLMLVLGILGYLIQKVEIPLAPVVLGLILGPLAEKGLRHGLQLGGLKESVWSYFFLRPISLAIIILTIVFLLFPFYQSKRRKKFELKMMKDDNFRQKTDIKLNAGKKPVDFVISGIVVVLSVVGFFSLGNDIEGARIFPILCFSVFIILSVLLIFQNLMRTGWASALNGGWCGLPSIPWKNFVTVSAAYILFILSIQWIGFVASSFIFIFVVVIYTDYEKAGIPVNKLFFKYLVFTIIATLGIYLLFIRVLNLSLPMNLMDFIFG